MQTNEPMYQQEREQQQSATLVEQQLGKLKGQSKPPASEQTMAGQTQQAQAQQPQSQSPQQQQQQQQMHVCRLCYKLLSSSSSLDRHMLTHSGERPFVCKRCHMTFTTNGKLRTGGCSRPSGLFRLCHSVRAFGRSAG